LQTLKLQHQCKLAVIFLHISHKPIINLEAGT